MPSDVQDVGDSTSKNIVVGMEMEHLDTHYHINKAFATYFESHCISGRSMINFQL